jgi:uncharacterized membrane protein YgcG
MYRAKYFLKYVLLACVALLCLGAIVCIQPVYAASGSYDFELSSYDVVYEINADRTMHITENIEIHFLGSESTGFLRDIPVNGGERVKNVVVYNNDGSVADYSVIIEDSNYITVDIGSTSIKTNQTYLYKLVYDYEVTTADASNMLSINPIGFGWDCEINNASITLVLPQGYKTANMFIGSLATTPNGAYTYHDDTNTITTGVAKLSKHNGVTMDLYFEDGVLSTPFNMTPIYILIVGVVLLVVLLAVKFLAFNTMPLTPTVNFTAPDEMDPLMMGKLIDNKVNTEDVTSLIYYWANKGYIKINLNNEKNPTFIRIYRHLPEGTPSYQCTMYNNMFRYGDTVSVKDLEYKFYTTVDAVKRDINSKSKALYDSKSIGVSILFALLGTAFICITPIVVACVAISTRLLFLGGLALIIPAFVVYALVESLMYNKIKISNKKFVLMLCGIILVAAIVSGFYVYIMPNIVLDMFSKIIVCVIGFAVIILSITIVSRTKEYTDKLNKIVGFRNFILYTEKDKLETMIEEDPQFYYNILPYAQVLGVTDKWQEKFASITLQPPQWMSNPVGTYLEFAIINRSLKSLNTQLVSRMVARPSPSGLSGGGGHIGGIGGGGFGGFGGGGHGGGGGRGR